MPGVFHHVPFGDLDALRAAVSPDTAAVLLEPVQGEGGVRPAPEGYLEGARALCDETGALLVFDEVQCGMGRTGHFFAHQSYGVTPDVVVLAKALGNGVPIGAIGCNARAASGFAVGSHASTFGGNPLCTAAALATVDALTAPGFLARVREVGGYFRERLDAIANGYRGIREVRGRGLMLGVEFHEPVKPVVEGLRDAGILCGPAGPNVLRFVPPLTLERAHVDTVIDALTSCLQGAPA